MDVRTMFCTSYNGTRAMIRVARGGVNHSARKRRAWYTYCCPLCFMQEVHCSFAASVAEQSSSILYDGHYDCTNVFFDSVSYSSTTNTAAAAAAAAAAAVCVSSSTSVRGRYHRQTTTTAGGYVRCPLGCLRQWHCCYAAAAADYIAAAKHSSSTAQCRLPLSHTGDNSSRVPALSSMTDPRVR